ncbi:MAG: ParB/RepB/Spo0J family partition protein [Elusimicrobia bacterium]|nr:ParB/RepB/Spo0J family partition protein [Elusimicrobiota bacterium]
MNKGAVVDKPKIQPAPPPVLKFAGDLPVAQIRTNGNPRKVFDPKGLQELAADIKENTVMSPLIVQLVGKEHVLWAGERRLRAAKLVGLATVPVRAYEMTDIRARAMQASENLQREDLNPIEEAQGYKNLLDAGDYTVDTLADKAHKSAVTVSRSLRLLELPKEIQEAIAKGTLSAAHGHQILRVPKDKLAKIVKMALASKTEYAHGRTDDGEFDNREVEIGLPTVKELQLAINNEVGTRLAVAQFCTDKTYASAVACTACVYNDATQAMLFDEASEHRCLNRACYDKKTEQFYLDLQAEGKRKWPALDFVGRGKQHNYNKRSVEGLPGNAMVSAEEQSHAVIKKLLEKRPRTLGYAVVLPRENNYNSYGNSKRWDKARLILVVKDPSLIGGTMTDKIVDHTGPRKASPGGGAAGSSQGSAPKPADPKAQFVAEYVKKAVCAAVAEKGKGLKTTLADWRELADRAVQDLDEDIVEGVMKGVEVSEANEDEAHTLVLLHIRIGWNGNDAKYKKLGVNVDGVRSKSKAEALKKWGEQQAKKPVTPPAAKGGK